MMKFIHVFLLALLVQINVAGQIFKKQVIQPPSLLDNIKITENFSGEYLDSVYNTLSRKYGLKIIYDTAYCSTIVFSYWYMNTIASRAIEITTRETDLTYQIDSTLTIYVKAKHFHNVKRGLPGYATDTKDKISKQKNPHTDFSLSGHIIDDSTNETLSGAYIKIKNTSIGTVSKEDGSYTLDNVPCDTVTLLVSYVGYVGAEVYLNDKINKHDFTIGLQPEQHMLGEAVITADRADIMKMSTNTISTIKLTPAKLAEIPNVGEKDVMRTFQLMPGISAANESSSGLYVRGGTPDQNLVLYDGFTVYQVDHLYGFFSAFNANAVKEVELFKGGFSAKYGGRLSSVTDITGKEGSTKQFNLGGELSLLSANLFTEIPVTENLSITGAARRSWNGPIYNWIFNSFNRNNGSQSSGSGRGPRGADEVTKAKSYFYDINSRVTFKPTSKDVFIYSFFNGSDDLNNSFSISAPPFLASMGISLNLGTTDVTTYSNTGMSAVWQREWSKKMHSSTIVSYSNFTSDRNRITTGFFGRSGSEDSSKTGVFENNNLKDVSFKSDYEWNIAKWNQLSFGVFATQYDIQYTYSHSDTNLLVDNHNNSLLAGAFLQDQISFFKEKLVFTPGIRFSYFNATGQQYTEPRMALNYNAGHNISFKAAYGKFYQFANRITRDDISTGSSQFWVLSDNNTVPVSSSSHYIAGISYEVPTFLFSVEGYYKELNNISLYTESSSATTTTINYNHNFYTGSGYSQGIELTAQKKAGKFTGWVSYTRAKTMYLFPVYSNDYFPADQDVRNEFKIVGMYKMKHWDFAATWIYASGKPYTAPGGSYGITLLDGSTESYVTATSKNTLRLPDYHRMDVAVNYHFYNEAKKDVGYIGLSLFNIYARENVWYKQFTVVDKYVVETNVNYLGFTPNLTLSLKLR